MSHTDNTRPYRIRIQDPTEPTYQTWNGQTELLKQICLNRRCPCKGDGTWDDPHKANKRNRQHKKHDINERINDTW